VVSYLEAKNIAFDAERLTRFRTGLGRWRAGTKPDFKLHGKLSDRLTAKAVRLTADFQIRDDLFLIILTMMSKEKGLLLQGRLGNMSLR